MPRNDAVFLIGLFDVEAGNHFARVVANEAYPWSIR